MSCKVTFTGRRPTYVAKIIVKAVREDAPREIKRQGLAWFDNSFKNQGFTDDGFQPWKPRKNEQRRILLGGKRRFSNKAPENRAILIKSGRLRRGNDAIILPGLVRFFNRVPYSEIQNKGGRAGRKLAAFIPKRQFIGKSTMMIEEMKRGVRRIINASLRS
jgi:hypothetical protein